LFLCFSQPTTWKEKEENLEKMKWLAILFFKIDLKFS
jgi:hypothetical protein